MIHASHEDGPDRPSLARQMILRLAKMRVQEARSADMGTAQLAPLILAVDRLAGSVEDLIALVEADHPEDASGL